MPARFVLKQQPIRSVAHDGWYSNAKQGHFQMVPLDGTRAVEVQADDGQSYRVTGGESVVWFAGAAQGYANSQNNDVALAKAPNVPQRIAIYGKRSATTRLILQNDKGIVQDRLEISVKKQLTRTYRMWTLRDVFNASVRTPAQIRDAMLLAEQLLFNQANIKMSAVGGDATLLFVYDVGNPIKSPIQLMASLSVLIKAMPGPTADYDVVSTWDIEHNVGISAPILNIALVEDYLPGRDIEEASTFAHELCHTFGAWLHENEAGLLMSESGDGTQMSRSVMHKVNDSGR